MALFCTSCTKRWEAIAIFCPSCGRKLEIEHVVTAQVAPIPVDYENQNLKILQSPATWVLVALLAFGLIFAFAKSTPEVQIQSTESSSQMNSPEQNYGADQPLNAEYQAEETDSLPTSEDSLQDQSPTSETAETAENSRSFAEPRTKTSLTLENWLKKYSVDNALISIQKWSATHRTMNPTQIDEVQTELGDAIDGLVEALRHIESQGSPRVSVYDQQQQDLENEVRKYIEEAGPLWIRINNGDFGSRKEISDYLAGIVETLKGVNTKVNSLISWLNANGSQFEAG